MWRGCKNRMTTQNRQKSNAKKELKKYIHVTHIVCFCVYKSNVNDVIRVLWTNKEMGKPSDLKKTGEIAVTGHQHIDLYPAHRL